MQVVIQTTRHFAHICYYILLNVTKYFYLVPYIAVRVGLYLHLFKMSSVWSLRILFNLKSLSC